MAKGPFRDSQAPYWISGARTDVPAAGPNPLLIDIVIDLYQLVMGIGHIFKIDDRYTNIDQWSIISDNYLLNVFTDYNYSDSLYFKSMLDKSKDLNKILWYIYKLQFFHL